jgi:hypothetical protein
VANLFDIVTRENGRGVLKRPPWNTTKDEKQSETLTWKRSLSFLLAHGSDLKYIYKTPTPLRDTDGRKHPTTVFHTSRPPYFAQRACAFLLARLPMLLSLIQTKTRALHRPQGRVRNNRNAMITACVKDISNRASYPITHLFLSSIVSPTVSRACPDARFTFRYAPFHPKLCSLFAVAASSVRQP